MDVQTTATPESEVKPWKSKVLDPRDNLWSAMGVALYEGITNSLSDRSDFDQLLDYYNDLYEMNVAPKQEPWPNAPSICVPLVRTQTEAVVSRMMSAVFVPRLFVVNGNTEEACKTDHLVERFYNAEFRKRNMLMKMQTCLHLSARDGTAIMENIWKKKVVQRKVLVYKPVLDKQGVPVMGPDGKPKREASVDELEITEIDAFDPQPVELRDFIVMPAWATSIESAEAVGRKIMLTQSQLQEMINADVLDQEWTEKAWAYLTQGDNDLDSDPQGTATYQLGGTISVGDAGTDDPAGDDMPGGKLRGSLRIWRVHSNQFDLDGDGLTEENVFWIHDESQFLLGWAPYEYWHGRRPFSALCLMPRPNRFYGFGVPESLRSLQEEINAQHNQRLAYMDLILNPPRFHVSGTKTENQDNRWGLNTDYEVSQAGDVGILALPDVPASTWSEESVISTLAGQLTGVIGPGLPAMGTAKINQKQQQAYQQSANIRQDLMSLQVRQWIEDILFQWHHLNLQYGPDQFETTSQNENGKPQKLTIDKEVLAADYDLAVAGMSGPLDRDSRRSDTLTLYSLLMQNPLVQGDLTRVWATTMMVLEEFNRPDVPQIIGTMQDAQQKAQQQAQAQQQAAKMQMQMAMVEHGNTTQQLNQEAAESKQQQQTEQLKQQQLKQQIQNESPAMQLLQASGGSAASGENNSNSGS